MSKFPVDASIDQVIRALELIGFVVVRRGNHIALQRDNENGTSTPMTLPNHRNLKSSTLRHALTHANVTREDFLTAYETL